jgi:DNA-binding transcriptional ArsR family regulator
MKPFSLGQPTISKHLAVLERAGLVSRGRAAQRRPRTLVAEPLKDIDHWLEAYRRFWEKKFASLDRYLVTLKKKDKRRRPARR